MESRSLARQRAAQLLAERGDMQQMIGTLLEGVSEEPYRAANHVAQDTRPDIGAQLAQQGAQRQQQAAQMLGSADELAAQEEALDPMSGRAQALQHVAQDQYGIDASGLGAEDILKAGVLAQGASLAKNRETQQGIQDRATAALEEQKRAHDDLVKGKDKLLAQKDEELAALQQYRQDKLSLAKEQARKRTGLGGASSAVLKQYTPEGIEARRQELESSGFSKTDVDLLKTVGPRQAFKIVTKNIKANPKTELSNGSPGGGFVLTPDGKLDIKQDEQQYAISKIQQPREKEKISNQALAIDQVRNAAAQIPKQALTAYFAAVGQFKDQTQALAHISSTFGNDIATKIARFDAAASGLAEDYGRPKSGAAIAASEWRNFKHQLGLGAFSNPQIMEQSLRLIEEKLERYDSDNLGGTGRAGAVALYNLYQSPGYKPKWIRKMAETVGVRYKLFARVLDAKTNKVVTVPIDRATQIEKNQLGRIIE